MDGHSKKGIEASNKHMVIWALRYLFWEDSHIMYNDVRSSIALRDDTATQLAHFLKTQCTQLAFLRVLGAQRATSGRQSWCPLLKSP